MSSPLSAAAAELGEFIDTARKLARLDALLLVAELREARHRITSSVAALALAAALAIFGVIFTLLAAMFFLVELGLRPSLSALIIGVAAFGVAGFATATGLSGLKNWSPAPRRTLEQVRANLDALRASFSNAAQPQP